MPLAMCLLAECSGPASSAVAIAIAIDRDFAIIVYYRAHTNASDAGVEGAGAQYESA